MNSSARSLSFWLTLTAISIASPAPASAQCSPCGGLSFTLDRVLPAPEGNAFALGVGENGFVWMHGQTTKLVYRMDPSDGSVLQSFPSGASTLVDLDVKDGIVVGAEEPTLYRYSAATGAPLINLNGPVSGGSRGMTFIGERLYVSGVLAAVPNQVRLGRVDQTTGGLQSSIPAPDLVDASGIGRVGQYLGYLSKDGGSDDVRLNVVDPVSGTLVHSEPFFQSFDSLFSLDATQDELFVSRRDLGEVHVFRIHYEAECTPTFSSQFVYSRALPLPEGNVFALGFGDDGFVWVRGQTSGTVYRLDPSDGSILSSFAGGSSAADVDVLGGTLYAGSEPSIFRFDTASGAAQLALNGPVIGGSRGLTFADGRLYVSGVLDGTPGGVRLGEVDPSTGALLASTHAPDLVLSSGLGAIGDSIAYVSNDGGLDNQLNVVDPSDGTLLYSEDLYLGFDDLVSIDSGGGELFVSRRDLGEIHVYSIVDLPPCNDDCANATVLPSVFADTPFDATGATTDGSDATGFCTYGEFGDGQNHNDIWFTYTPDVGGCTYISTLGLAGYDTRLTVYQGSGCPDDPSNIIACVDDELQPISDPFEAGLDVDLIAGQTYTIRLGTFDESIPAGPGVLRIAQGPGAAANSGGQNPGAPGCSPFIDLCNGDGGDQMGCTNCPCMNNAAQGTIGGCLNSAGTSTRLRPSGSDSIAAADLRFEASGAPANNSAVLTSGNSLAPANMANPCFGLNSGVTALQLDGLRCAVQGVLRHGVRPSDANGDVGVTTNGWGTPNGFFNFSTFVSGSTKHFQIIHRDDSAVVCMTGQNTSQAVSVSFKP